MHTSLEMVGQSLDMSLDYQERWQDPDTLIITHTGISGRRKGQTVQRTLTRIPSQPSEIDGVWRVEVADLTEQSAIPGEHVVVRFGDYIGFFVQDGQAPLHAIFAKELSANQYRILFSTRSEESEGLLDFSKDHVGGWRDQKWIESYTATGDFHGRPGHKIERIYSRMPD
jgi:hypothetical protein